MVQIDWLYALLRLHDRPTKYDENRGQFFSVGEDGIRFFARLVAMIVAPTPNIQARQADRDRRGCPMGCVVPVTVLIVLGALMVLLIPTITRLYMQRRWPDQMAR